METVADFSNKLLVTDLDGEPNSGAGADVGACADAQPNTPEFDSEKYGVDESITKHDETYKNPKIKNLTLEMFMNNNYYTRYVTNIYKGSPQYDGDANHRKHKSQCQKKQRLLAEEQILDPGTMGTIGKNISPDKKTQILNITKQLLDGLLDVSGNLYDLQQELQDSFQKYVSVALNVRASDPSPI